MREESPHYVADFDSASAMLRALARFLHGRDFPDLGMSPRLRPLAIAANLLPPRLRDEVYAWSGWAEATPAKRLAEVRAEDIARWIVDAYPRRRYPAVAIGSSSGALVHLCAALGIPWLPQTLLIPVRQTGVGADDPRQSMAAGIDLGRALLDANPDLELHHMHDPNQDRLMVRRMTYFRVKRLRLGPAFERFLQDSLEPGGTILLSECERQWPTTRVGERHVFQFGALGGATVEDYFEGGPRVQDYLERYGSPLRRWDPPEPDAERPEAEWGFASALRDDVERLARERDHRVARLLFDDPEHLSTPVAELYRSWYGERGLPGGRLLVESFILLEPWWTLRTGSVPFWLTFNTEPSADWLERYLAGSAPYDEIAMMLFAHGTEGVGLVPIERWRSILQRAPKGQFIGVDESKYPRDFATFARYHPALRKIAERHPMPEPLGLQEVERFFQALSPDGPVRWQA